MGASWIHAQRHDTTCQDVPRTAAPRGFRHRVSQIKARLGEPWHRGVDVITSTTTPAQRVEGHLGYGADKSLEDEDVELYACITDAWTPIGEARTDDDGQFAVELAADRRLPPGLHALYASVVGDRTGVGFLAYVAPADARVVVTDVDGTLTGSEDGIVRAVVFGSTLTAQPDAGGAFQQLVHAGFQPVYLTSRPRGLTELTRRWLADHGFPPGPLVLAPGITLPGRPSLEHKTTELARLRNRQVPLTVAIGNRATDVVAYTRAGIPGERIFMKGPEFEPELDAYVSSKGATEFVRYAALPDLVIASTRPPAAPADPYLPSR